MPTPPIQRTTFDQAIDLIASERVIWVRAAAVRRANAWSVRLLELTGGDPPRGWAQMSWDYPWAHFAAFECSGDAVSGWLKAKALPLAGHEASLSQTMDPAWERRQSHGYGRYGSLEWPIVEAPLAMVDTSAEPQDHLVSAGDTPSFINLYTAAAQFFYLRAQPSGGSLPHELVYRYQDTRGRIQGVQIRPDEVAVDLEGDTLGEMILELAGDEPGTTVRLVGSEVRSGQTVRFPLRDGLPEGAWLLLRRGEEWIDKRFLGQRWARRPEAGVEYIVEPRARLEAYLADREGPEVEFKLQAPTTDESKSNVVKTVCAFANGQGGSILFGVDDEHGAPGLPRRDIPRVVDQLTRIVDSWLEPRPEVGFESLPIDLPDRVVLEMKVGAGAGLYGCGRPGDPSVPHIRHHALSVRARPGEMEEIVRARSQWPTLSDPLRRWGLGQG